MASSDRRAERRLQRVRSGVDALVRWMEDQVRQGLARLEHAGGEPFEEQGRRLVDAKARSLGRRVTGWAALPGSGPEWPARLLDEMGRVALLAEALDRLEALPEGLADEVKRRIGWSLRKAEVREQGERVADAWAAIGRVEGDDERLRWRRDWLIGLGTGRVALVLQFAHGRQRFDADPAPGTVLEGTLCFWPAARPQRALVVERTDQADLAELPGPDRLEAFLDRVAGEVAADPWASRTAGVVRAVVPMAHEGQWWLRDADGRGLPLAGEAPWNLLALSGGHPVDVAFEWSGQRATVLSAVAGGRWWPVGEG